MIKIAFVATAALLAGCALEPRPLTFEEMADQKPPKCSGAQHCAAMWQRAQAWVATNSRYKIQIATDVVIQTYTPTRSSTDLGFTIVREVVAPDQYRFITKAGCDNIFGCMPSREKALAALHRYMKETPQ